MISLETDFLHHLVYWVYRKSMVRSRFGKPRPEKESVLKVVWGEFEVTRSTAFISEMLRYCCVKVGEEKVSRASPESDTNAGPHGRRWMKARLHECAYVLAMSRVYDKKEGTRQNGGHGQQLTKNTNSLFLRSYTVQRLQLVIEHGCIKINKR